MSKMSVIKEKVEKVVEKSKMSEKRKRNRRFRKRVRETEDVGKRVDGCGERGS